MQCTTYCKKRWREVHNTDLEVRGDANAWYYYDFEGQYANTSPRLREDSVACFEFGECGHVIFIEKVYSDGEFKFSEANCPNHVDGRIYNTRDFERGYGEDGMDAYIRKCLPGGDFLGCIYRTKTPNVGA